MANIHRLQHEEQMKLAAANEQMLKERSRARTWSLLALLTLVASVSAIAVVVHPASRHLYHQWQKNRD